MLGIIPGISYVLCLLKSLIIHISSMETETQSNQVAWPKSWSYQCWHHNQNPGPSNISDQDLPIAPCFVSTGLGFYNFISYLCQKLSALSTQTSEVCWFCVVLLCEYCLRKSQITEHQKGSAQKYLQGVIFWDLSK